MPGPGPHLMYTLGIGTGLMHISRGAFTSHHCLVYALNAFLGPDLGSFLEWITHTSGMGKEIGAWIMDYVHDPLYYILLLGVPLSFLYSRLSALLLHKSILGTSMEVSLNFKQSFYLICAGSLSHFFLDNLFEENGHTRMLTWILSTGWWKGNAPINIASSFVIGSICLVMLGCFIQLNRPRTHKPAGRWYEGRNFICVGIGALLYSIWCAIHIYWYDPPQPPVGEEADLGVLVFLAIFFFLPHGLCVMSMHHTGLSNEHQHEMAIHSV